MASVLRHDFGYNDTIPQSGPSNLLETIGKQIRPEGVLFRQNQDVPPHFFGKMTE